MANLGKLMGDSEAMKRFGNTVVIWDLHSRKPLKVLDVPGAPLEIRCAWGAHNDYCFTTTALTSKIWLIYEDDKGEWQAKAVADIGDASKIPLPVDISIAADDSLLWVDTWNDGTARLFDISDPFKPVQIQETKIGAQLNMASQSWDGNRIYFTSSLLANWDKVEAQRVKTCNSSRPTPGTGRSSIISSPSISSQENLGLPHQMRFGAYALYGQTNPLVGKSTPQSDMTVAGR